MKAYFLRAVFVFLGSFLLGGHAFASPLNNWIWRNPLPNGNYVYTPIAYNINSLVFTNGVFYGAAAFGVMETSTDGIHWSTNSTPTTNQLNDIIYANDGFIAVGNSGTVETSANGTNWVLQNSGTTSSLSSVAYGNGKYAAVGNAVIASTDGVHWSPAVSGLSGASELAGGAAGFVAVTGTNQEFTSSDGLHWTSQTLAVPVAGYSGALGNSPEATLAAQIVTSFNGNFLVGGYIYVRSGMVDLFMYSSPDGAHWTTNSIGSSYALIGGFDFSFFLTGNAQAIAAGQASNQPFLLFSQMARLGRKPI